MKTLVFGFITTMVIAFMVGAYWHTEHHEIHAYKEVIKQYKKEIGQLYKRIGELEEENESYDRFVKCLLYSDMNTELRVKLDTVSFYTEFLHPLDSARAAEMLQQSE